MDDSGELETLIELEAAEDDAAASGLRARAQTVGTGGGNPNDGGDRAIQQLRQRPEFDAWQHGCSSPHVPSALLDRSLRIVWCNDGFAELFLPGTTTGHPSLLQLYSDYLGEEDVERILARTRAEEHGYSWWGRIEHKGDRQSTVFANLTIVPLFGIDNGDRPIAYHGILNDVSEEYRDLLQRTFRSLLEAAKLKDNDTGHHVERVNRYARVMAEELQGDPAYPIVDEEFVQDISMLAAMHDVGKIGTPDDILNKAGSLEEWEWEVMREHTINGAFLLGTYPNPMARQIALRHHERWDGSGYPHGLAADLIPVAGRIVSVGDVYDALRMKRHYKPAFEHERTVEIIREGIETHFEPRMVEVFETVSAAFRDIFDRLIDS